MVGVTYTETVEEAVGGLDIVSARIVYDLAQYVQVTVSELLSATRIATGTLAETVTSSDANSAVLSVVDRISEPLAASDAMTGGFAIAVALSDAVQTDVSFGTLYGPEGWYRPGSAETNWQSSTASAATWVVRRADPPTWQ